MAVMEDLTDSYFDRRGARTGQLRTSLTFHGSINLSSSLVHSTVENPIKG